MVEGHEAVNFGTDWGNEMRKVFLSHNASKFKDTLLNLDPSHYLKLRQADYKYTSSIAVSLRYLLEKYSGNS